MKSNSFLPLAVAVLVAFSASSSAQDLGAFKPAVQKYALNKIGADDKRIHIAQFNVNFQAFNARTEFKQGGSKFGGGMKGDATAQLAVALAGFSEQDLSAATDKLYGEFRSLLESKGYTLIGADEAAQAEEYKGWTRVAGGAVEKSPIPGLISVTPKGFDYFIQSEESATKKKGPFAAVAAQGRFGSLSQQLGDAIIAEVDLSVVFTEEGNSWDVGVAKINMRPNLRLVDTYTIVNDKKKGGFISLKGAQSFDTVTSRVAFHHGKVGMGVRSAYIGTLKSPLEIDGVIDEKKIVSFAKGGTDTVGASNAFYTVYSAESRSTKEIKTLQVDSAMYSKGIHAACQKMIVEHTNGFFGSL